MFTAIKKSIRHWRGIMFQRMAIHLDGPICKCRTKDLGWSIIIVDEQLSLGVHCNQCKQELRIAPTMFRASFVLDEEYPETAVPEPLITKDGSLIDASKRFLQ